MASIEKLKIWGSFNFLFDYFQKRLDNTGESLLKNTKL